MRYHFPLILICGLLGLAACSNAPTADDVVDTATEGVVAAPKAEVIGARVDEQTAVAGRVILTVKLTNPNAVDLPLMRARYSFAVAGERYRGSDVPHVVLPASGVMLVELPGVIASGQPLAGRSFKASGTVTYQPPGEVRELLTEYRVPLPTTSFRGGGTLAYGHEVPGNNAAVAE